MTVHSGLTLGRLHDEKGVATALANQAYVSNGSNSGVWTTLTDVVQIAVNHITTYSNAVTAAIPLDDTIPQITEGREAITCSITPTNVNNKLLIEASLSGSNQDNAQHIIFALFQDSTANALAAGCFCMHANNSTGNMAYVLRHYMTAGTVSATTFSARMATASGLQVQFNGDETARRYGGVSNLIMTIKEIRA